MGFRLIKMRVPHLRDSLIVAKVGLVCGSKRPLVTPQALLPQLHHSRSLPTLILWRLAHHRDMRMAPQKLP